MNGNYEAPALEWDHEKAVKFYKHYMRQFWGRDVRPFDPPHRERLDSIFKKSFEDEPHTVGLLAKEKIDILRFGAVYLMSIGKRVFWQYFDAVNLLSDYLDNKSPLDEVNEYEYAIISYHGGGNRYLPRFMDMLVTQREIKRFYTFVVSTADTEWLGTPLFDPFVGLDGAYKWSYTSIDRTGITIRSRDKAVKITEGSTKSTTELPEFKEIRYTVGRYKGEEPKVESGRRQRETKPPDVPNVNTKYFLPEDV